MVMVEVPCSDDAPGLAGGSVLPSATLAMVEVTGRRLTKYSKRIPCASSARSKSWSPSRSSTASPLAAISMEPSSKLVCALLLTPIALAPTAVAIATTLSPALASPSPAEMRTWFLLMRGSDKPNWSRPPWARPIITADRVPLEKVRCTGTRPSATHGVNCSRHAVPWGGRRGWIASVDRPSAGIARLAVPSTLSHGCPLRRSPCSAAAQPLAPSMRQTSAGICPPAEAMTPRNTSVAARPASSSASRLICRFRSASCRTRRFSSSPLSSRATRRSCASSSADSRSRLSASTCRSCHERCSSCH
mmetsp:Transcript_3419/g.10742  ORF Transcript_3419/g.10742 Transcript_3419/m.10742 type:complete len:304 (+) Transcript_3419:156-1067(+)